MITMYEIIEDENKVLQIRKEKHSFNNYKNLMDSWLYGVFLSTSDLMLLSGELPEDHDFYSENFWIDAEIKRRGVNN